MSSSGQVLKLRRLRDDRKTWFTVAERLVRSVAAASKRRSQPAALRSYDQRNTSWMYMGSHLPSGVPRSRGLRPPAASSRTSSHELPWMTSKPPAHRSTFQPPEDMAFGKFFGRTYPRVAGGGLESQFAPLRTHVSLCASASASCRRAGFLRRMDSCESERRSQRTFDTCLMRATSVPIASINKWLKNGY